jgi:solute carrier family 25 folate transporter 32
MKATGGASPNRKITVLSHVKYEHLVAGISGGVASTLILHPLDLIKIRFAGNVIDLFQISFGFKHRK